MRYLTLLTLILINCNLYGQMLKRTPYEVRMNSIAASKWHLGEDIKRYKDVVDVRPTRWFKLSVNVGINKKIAQDIYASLFDDDMSDEVSGEDYLNLGKYNIRLKVYLTKKVKLVNRVLVTGLDRNGYQYSSGIILKF